MLLPTVRRPFTFVIMSVLFLMMLLPLNILSDTAFAQTKPVQCSQGALCPLKTASHTSTAHPLTTTNLTVNANQDVPGLDTGIDLISGSNLTITASGEASYDPGSTQDCSTTGLTNPNGQRLLSDGTVCSPDNDPAAVLPSSPVGTLIAQIGSSGWFAVGSSDGLTVATNGRLFLLYNDDSGQYGNNSGSYQVTVTTSSSSALTVQKVWTGDGNNNAKTSFAPGDAIHYLVQVTNSGSNTVTATFTLLATGPQQILSWSGSVSVPAGTTSYYYPTTVPSNAPAGTYTLTVTVTYNGGSSQGQSQFAVIMNRGKLFLFIQGINSTLSTADATNNIIPTNQYSFGQPNGIYQFLLKTYPTAQFRMFSYDGADSRGTPKGYLCQDTFTQHLRVFVARLKAQITSYLNNHPNTDVYLIGHSMGGAVAMGLLADMKINGFLKVNGGKVAGVVSLDSPLGGTDPLYGVNSYFTKQNFQGQCMALVPKNKPPLPTYSLDDLFSTFGPGTPYGGMDSIMIVINGGDFSNQEVVAAAASNNSPVLTIGNPLDFVYTNACPLTVSNFPSTQWVADQGNSSGAYGRVFNDDKALKTCTDAKKQIAANHFDVFTNKQVKQGLQQFINGQTPTALMVAPNGP